MKTISLKVKSSSGKYYQVVLEISEIIKVNCNCGAGIFGKLCKHKTGLLSGDYALLYDLSEKPVLDDLIKILSKSDYISLSKEFLSAQKAVDSAIKHEKKIKHILEQALKVGISFKSEN